MRAGKSKMRKCLYIQFRGHCTIYNEDNGVIKTFRNIPGIVLFNVSKLLPVGAGEISAFGLTVFSQS